MFSFKHIKQIFLRLQRHRRFQLGITLGTLFCALGGYVFPVHQELLVVAGVMTNLAWIWEA